MSPQITTTRYVCDVCGKEMPEVGWDRIGWMRLRVEFVVPDDAFPPETIILCDEHWPPVRDLMGSPN